MKQRLGIAEVLIKEPKLMFLDEPTPGLDEETISRIMDILNNLDTSYIIVSHEYGFLARTTTDIFRMKDAALMYDGSSENLHSHYHRHPMGKKHHEHH